MFAENVYTYCIDKNRMRTITLYFANSTILRVCSRTRLKTFSDVDSKSAKADM